MAEYTARVARRGHLHEIDVVRSITAVGVVGVHTVSFALVLAHTDAAQLMQNAAVGALHFTREIFLAITAFVMVYTYANRQFSTKTFWRKRGLGVLLPYAIWSIFYDATTKPPLPAGQWTLRAVSDILLGGASFQLYYILLTLEFYLVLPWFLWLITHAGKRPWLLLGVSFAVQVILLAVNYRYVQTGPFSVTPVGQFINLYQSRFLPLYQFYAILGGVAAFYLPQIRAFTQRYGGWSIIGVALSLALLWGNLLYQVVGQRHSIAYGISVFQPAMVIYAIAVAALLYWLAYRWASHRAPQPPRGARFWLLLSDASFGIYLLHAYFLRQAMALVVPRLPTFVPEPVNVLFLWGLVAGATIAVCVVFLYTPGLSRLIGHPCALRADRGAGRWLAEAALASNRALQRLAALAWPPGRRAGASARTATAPGRGRMFANRKNV